MIHQFRVFVQWKVFTVAMIFSANVIRRNVKSVSIILYVTMLGII